MAKTMTPPLGKGQGLRDGAAGAAALLCVLSLLAIDARAQEPRGFYIGMTWGELAYENYHPAVSDYKLKETGNQQRLLGGFRINDKFSVEGNWAETAGIDWSYGSYSETWSTEWIEWIEADIEILSVRAIGTVAFNRVRLMGGVGYYGAEIDGDYSWGTNIESNGWTYFGPVPLDDATFLVDDLDHSGATLSGGVQVDFYTGPSFRAEAEYYFTPNNVSLYAFSVGVLYEFGRRRTWFRVN